MNYWNTYESCPESSYTPTFSSYVLSWGRRDYQISFSNRDTSRNGLNSSLRKFYDRYGDLIKQYEVSLSPMLNDILWPDHIQWQPLTDQSRILSGFHRTFATGMACRQGTLTPPDTWSCPIWDLQMFFCWDHWHSSIHYTTNSRPFPWFTSYWIWHYWI